MENKDIDISKSLRHFFDLKDWQARAVFFGGVYVLIFVASFALTFISFFVRIIPIVGWILSCFFSLAPAVFSFVFYLYVEGYRVDVIKAVASKQSVEAVAYNADYIRRVKAGVKIFLANLVYYLPLMVIVVIAFFFMFGSTFLVATTTPSDYSSGARDSVSAVGAFGVLGTSLLFYAVIFLGIIYQTIVTYIINPPMYVFFSRKGTVRSMLQFGGIWLFIKKNWMNMLIYAAITFGVAFVSGMLLLVSVFSIIVCIGIILFPVVYALTTTYIIHLQADMLGQLSALDKEIK